jgi:hypothetical protein
VKVAAPSDLPDLVGMMERFHDHNQPPWPFDRAAASQTMAQLIDAHDALVLIGGGFIAGVIQPNPLSPGWLVAKEFLWWSEDRHGLRLLRGFREWARKRGASEIQMSCPAGARAEKAFGRHGAAQEIIYSEISHVS